MFKNELIKLITNKAFYLSVFIVMALNILFQYYQTDIRNTTNIYPQDYRNICSNLENISDGEKIVFLNESIEKMIYSGNMIEKLDLYRQLLLEVQQCNEYNSKIEKVIQNTQNQLQNSKITPSEIARLKAINYKYGKLINIHLKFSNSYGVMQIIENRIIDVLLPVLILLICIIVICYEREQGIDRLSIITLNGKTKHTVVKFSVLMATIAVLCTIFIFQNVIWASVRWGLGDLTAPIQRIYGMDMCSLNMKVLSFLLVYCGMKILYYCAIGSFVFGVCQLFKNTAWSVTITGTMFILLQVMYDKLDFNSVLKLYSPINWGNVKYITEKYRSVYFAGSSFNLLYVFFIIQIIFVITMLLTSIKCTEIVLKKNRIIHYKNIEKIHMNTNLFVQETYKSFLGSGVYIVCIIMIVSALVTFVKPSYNRIDTQNAFYKMYCEKLEGLNLNEAKKLLDEQKKYVLDNIENPDCDEETRLTMDKALEALNIISNRLDKMKNDETIFWDEGYNKMLGFDREYSKYIHIRIILASLFSIMCFVGIMSIDTENGMDSVISCTKLGNKSYYIAKLICGFLIIFTATILYTGRDMFELLRLYGYKYINMRVRVLSLADTSFDNSILYSLIGEFLRYIFIALIFMLLCYYICKKQKSKALSICICEAICLLPQLCIYYINF